MVKCKGKTTSKYHTFYSKNADEIGDAPDYLTEQLSYVIDFWIRQDNTTARQKSLFYKELYLYNVLPFEIKNEMNAKVFRKKSVIFIRSIN